MFYRFLTVLGLLMSTLFAAGANAAPSSSSTETIVFQLLGGADSDAFRELSKLLR